MTLKNIQTDDLLQRWNMIMDNYLQELKQMKQLLIKINKKRTELLLIREELLLRDINVPLEDEEDCPEEPQKT